MIATRGPFGPRFASAVAAIVLAGWLGACSSARSPDPTAVYLDDSSVQSGVRSRLSEDRSMDSAGVQVAAVNGTVTLSGLVANSLAKTNAESIAMKAPGVRLVRNELTVRRP